ncbi:MAG: BRO-N domain-containing protein [Acidithiobacillus sp.]
MSDIIPFQYEGKAVRVLRGEDGEPWWVAVDVCKVLGIVNARDALTKLDDDEKKTVGITDGLIEQGLSDNVPGTSLNLVNEPGLYRLILTSRKPEAKAFKRWVTHEVLPQIRKTGGYTSPSKQKRPARIASPLEHLLPSGITIAMIRRDFNGLFGLARMVPGMSRNDAFLSTVERMSFFYKTDVRPFLPSSGLALASPMQEPELRATDIARRLGVTFRTGSPNGNAINKVLCAMGFVTETAGEELPWTPTEKGQPYAVIKDVPKAQTHGGRATRQLFWRESVLEPLKAALQ